MFKNRMALRLFLVNLVFLIVPTFVWLGFFLDRNHKETISDILYGMQDRCYARASRLEEVVNFHQDMLTILQNDLQLKETKDIDKQYITDSFKKVVVTVPSFENLLYIKKVVSGGYILWASNAYAIDREFDLSHHLLVTSALQYGKSMTLGFDLEGNPAAFVAQTVMDEAGDVKGIIAFVLNPERLLSSVSTNQAHVLEADFAILSEGGIVFADQNPEYRMLAAFALSDQKIRDLIDEGVFNPDKVKLMPVATPINLAPFEHAFEVKFPDRYRINLGWPVSKSNAVLTIGVDASALDMPAYEYIWRTLVITGTVFVLVLLLCLLLVNRLSLPLEQFISVIGKVSSTDLSSERYKKDVAGYEINEIGDAVNHMLDNLAVQVETIKNEPIRQKLISEELQLGHQIQQQLLPQHLPELAGCSLAAAAIPALEVGGDFYDVFLSEGQDKLFIAVADGAGKGISACLFALGLRSMFRSFAAHTSNVALTVRNANNLFCWDTKQSSMFATVVMGLFDPSSKTLTYYSAGHPPVLLRNKEGQVERLESSGIPIGIDNAAELTHKSVQLSAGDILLFYSDGVTEEMNSSGEMYGEIRLMNFLKGIQQRTPQAALDALLADVKAFSAEAPQHDDITAVMLYVT